MRLIPGVLVTTVFLATTAVAAGPATGPLRVHPKNPRYFADAYGKAVFLTGSHTWANFQERGVEGQTPDFDYERYLDFMVEHGHNFMRMWRWEHAQWMQFVPATTSIRYAPMAYERTGPGTALDGKPKLDLTRLDPADFDRLRRRVVAAGERGIYVSVMLFQGFSVEQKGTKGVDPKKGNAWDGHPYHAANNINSIDGDLNHDGQGQETHTLKKRDVTRLHHRRQRPHSPVGSDPAWVWKNLMRGNHFILMDHYMDFRMGSPKRPDPKHDPTRRAMGRTRELAEQWKMWRQSLNGRISPPPSGTRPCCT